MKRIVLLLVFGLGLQLSALAQPVVKLTTEAPCAGENFCMPVTVEDFTDILTMNFSVNWDPTVLDFNSVQNFNPAMMIDVIDDFDVTMTNDGKLAFMWEFNGPCVNTNPGLTFTDDQVNTMFEICFDVPNDVAYGAISAVTVGADPIPIEVTRTNPIGCLNIGLIKEDGLVSTCVRPLEIIGSSETGNPGDQVCVDFIVNGFDDMTSMQFSLNYDETILQFENVIIPQNLPNLATSSFGVPPQVPDGNITVVWAFVDINNPGVTVPDGTSIFQLCFRIIGECENVSPVTFSNLPTPTEVTNVVEEGFNITFIPQDGSVTVGDCDPEGLPLIANCGDPVDINDEVCVEVTTNEFNNISDMSFLMDWNATILEFVEVRNIANIPGNAFDINDFNTANVGNGILGIDWESTPGPPNAVLPDGSVLFEVCYNVVGIGGNSPITFSGNPAIVQVNNGTNIGINPTNCEVVVNQPGGVTMSISAEEAQPGDELCMDVAVANFVDIVSYQFSLTWDVDQLDFVGIQNIDPAFGTLFANFNQSGVAGGALTFDNDDYASPTTIPDGNIVFQICFTVGEMAVPNNCDNVEIVDLPLEAEAITSESNGNNVGITQQGGEVCVLTPNGFFMDVAEIEGELFDTACVPLTVTAFTDITEGNFQLSFDPNALSCAGINDLGVIPNITVDESNCGVGLVGFSWTSDPGLTLADSTAIFEVCFALDGPPNACYPVEITGTPEPIANTADTDGTIFADDDGEICILDKIFILDTLITGISCPGLEDGEICLNALTGTDILLNGQDTLFTVLYNWDTDPVQFGNCAENLPPGEVTVTIFALEAPELIQEVTFTIPDNTNAPVAEAGPDEPLNCIPGVINLTGTATGDNVTVRWENFLGDEISNTDQVVVDQTGGYVFIVTNEAGTCEDRDTVLITEVPSPVAEAIGASDPFDCQTDSLQLSSEVTNVIDNLEYEWTTMDGQIAPGNETLAEPFVYTAGTYFLIVTNTETGCASTEDSIAVETVAELPEISIETPDMIGCGDDAMVTLVGSGTSDVGVVTFQWTDTEGTPLPGGDSETVVVTEPGTYYLTGTTEINGCSVLDSIEVMQNADFPVVEITGDTVRTCSPDTDTLTLTANVSNAANFDIIWMAADGGEFVAGTETTINLEVTAPGTFTAMVTNSDNSCDVSEVTLVIENNDLPTAEAGMPAVLDCDPGTMTLLDGTGSDVDGVTYEWTFESDATILSDQLTYEATTAGTYFLTVRVDSTDCTAIDSVEVTNTPDQPSVVIDGAESLTCGGGETVTLTANITPADGEYSIQWFLDGMEIADATEIVYEASEGGEYTVNVVNTSSNCDADALAVNIVDETNPPTTIAGADASIDCNNMMATLDGTGSETGDDIVYQWTAVVDGETPTPDNEITANVSTAGTYVLTVTNMATMCTETDTVVIADNSTLPQITAENPTELISCNNASVQVSATVEGFTEDDLDIEWTGPGDISDPNSLNPTVGSGGTYEVSITITATGCQASASVVVDQADDVPTAAVEATEVTLECVGTTVILDGSMSSQGDTISYSWEVVSGTINLEDANMNMATADNAGQVNLIVTNTNTGCADTTTVNIALAELEEAAAGDDTVGCETEGSLVGNLPAGATGAWTSAGGSIIVDPTASTTGVTGLEGGENVFIWTLSTDNCPDYSFDAVSIFLSVQPEAENDFVELEEGEGIRDINLVANDALNGAQNWSVEILGTPSLGQVTNNGDGMISYTAFNGRFGTDEFGYILCNLDCEDQIVCDTATIQVIVPEGEIEIPNGITPNGDGINDELVFDILNNPDVEYPDNEIIIYNRWGDIVYEAKPYLNDWNGQSNTGGELPHATYYYILRLNISEGEIIRGDITIIK